MLVTYQKGDGSIFQRIRNTALPYKIGEITSMGWKVLNIEYRHNDRYYSEHQYNKIIQKAKLTCIKRKRAIELCTQKVLNLLYYILGLLILDVLKNLIGM